MSVVFIVGLMISLFSIYRMGDLMDPDTEVTMVKTNAQGESEVVVKKGTQIDAYRVTSQQAAGDGQSARHRVSARERPDHLRAGCARRTRSRGAAMIAPRRALTLCLCGLLASPALAQQPPSPAQPASQSAQRPATPPSAPVRVLYVFSDGQMPVTLEAYKKLLDEHPELRDRVDLKFLTESVFDDVDATAATSSDVVVLDVMNQQMVDRFNTAHATNLIAERERRTAACSASAKACCRRRATRSRASSGTSVRARCGPDRVSTISSALLKLALGAAGVQGLDGAGSDARARLRLLLSVGRCAGGRVFADWDVFDAWRRANGKLGPARSRVAIGFYKSSYYTGDTETLDAVIAEVERQGAEAIPLFGYPGRRRVRAAAAR